MISTASHQAQQVIQNHHKLNSYAHCAALLLGDLAPSGTISWPKFSETSTQARPQAKTGSSRRKLWELSPLSVGPVLGVCLPFDAVQNMAHKVGLSVGGCAEYQLHDRVLKDCNHRTPLAELVQRELDRSFTQTIKRSQSIKTLEALTQWWNETCQGVDWVSAFWTVLTHPRCSVELEDVVLGQVRMLQYTIGFAAQTNATQLSGYVAEIYRLTQDLLASQQRMQTQAREQAVVLAALQAECTGLRTSAIRAEAERDLAQTQWRTLKNFEPDVLTHKRLVEDNQRLQMHNEKLLMRTLRRNTQIPDQLGHGQVSARNAKYQPDVQPTVAFDLRARQVLCVGGRTASIPVYRQEIEGRGASFRHHDGGEEDKASRLMHQLQAADVVICQVGCISHDAYWRVKEHCKRTGKTCLFVEMSGRSALVRALGQAVVRDAVTALDLA